MLSGVTQALFGLALFWVIWLNSHHSNWELRGTHWELSVWLDFLSLFSSLKLSLGWVRVMKTRNKKMLFFVSQTQTQWQFCKMEDLVEPTASVLSHHYLISLKPILLCHFSFFIFFLLPRVLLLFFVWHQRESKTRDWKLRRPRDTRTLRSDWAQARSFTFFFFFPFFSFVSFLLQGGFLLLVSSLFSFFFSFFLCSSLWFLLLAASFFFFFLQVVMVEMAEFGSPI